MIGRHGFRAVLWSRRLRIAGIAKVFPALGCLSLTVDGYQSPPQAKYKLIPTHDQLLRQFCKGLNGSPPDCLSSDRPRRHSTVFWMTLNVNALEEAYEFFAPRFSTIDGTHTAAEGNKKKVSWCTTSRTTARSRSIRLTRLFDKSCFETIHLPIACRRW